MSDESMRELERRWKQTGLPVDEEDWLRERVRAGELSPAQVELMRYCGPPNVSGETSFALRPWILGLIKFGRAGEVAAAVVAVAARRSLGRAETVLSREVYQCAVAWIACPCESHNRQVRALSSSLSGMAAYDDTLYVDRALLNVIDFASRLRCKECLEAAWDLVTIANPSSVHETSAEFSSRVRLAVREWAERRTLPAIDQ